MTEGSIRDAVTAAVIAMAQQRGCALTTFEVRALSQNRSRPDFRELLAINFDRQHTVEQQVTILSASDTFLPNSFWIASSFARTFASSGGFLGSASTWVTANWQPNGPKWYINVLYNGMYFLLILGFTYFYTAVVFDPTDVAENLKKQSTFIPGIRPGRSTAEYLGRVMGRITLAGALFLAVITVILPLFTAFAPRADPTSLYLGGTAILIVVGVALDTMKQIETQLLMRQYKGFIR